MASRAATCATCPWWDQENAREPAVFVVGEKPKISEHDAECRRRSPQLPDTYRQLWPRTRGRDWCGEHPRLSRVFR